MNMVSSDVLLNLCNKGTISKIEKFDFINDDYEYPLWVFHSIDSDEFTECNQVIKITFKDEEPVYIASCVSGYYHGNLVIVDSIEDLIALYSMSYTKVNKHKLS